MLLGPVYYDIVYLLAHKRLLLPCSDAGTKGSAGHAAASVPASMPGWRMSDRSCNTWCSRAGRLRPTGSDSTRPTWRPSSIRDVTGDLKSRISYPDGLDGAWRATRDCRIAIPGWIHHRCVIRNRASITTCVPGQSSLSIIGELSNLPRVYCTPGVFLNSLKQLLGHLWQACLSMHAGACT